MDSRDIGSLFMIGFQGTRFTPELRELIDDLNPNGIILFSRNIEDPVQLANLNRDLQRHHINQGLGGLLIGVDQEGGRVCRLKDPFTAFPSALELASSDDPEAAVRNFAATTAREMRLVGFNLDFVPVLDIVSQPENLATSVIGDRSYGPDAGSVSRLGSVVIQTMRSEGVIPCCKHFPGHGGTLVDSHLDLPVDDRPLDSINSADIIPFRTAADLNVEMIMTAHVLYPYLDPLFPATLSDAAVNGLLRESMGYNGVVITDDLDMAAVADKYSHNEAALQALRAGVDILLICNNPEAAFEARSRIFQAVSDGEIIRHRVEASLARIGNLKKLYASSMQPSDQARVKAHFNKG
ncbi:MAG: beta-N-acetylhexosaminidase [Desulfomonile tiedjei]|nr:beta-N-acetylhexosaminidase [Desulfomonile tiedjei]